MPSTVSKGDNFEATANITYPCSTPFDASQYSAFSCNATIELPEGLELALGETTKHSLGKLTAGNSVQTSWSILATETDLHSISVVITGIVEGSVGTHGTYPSYDYEDGIGGSCIDSLLVSNQTCGVRNLDTGLNYTTIQEAIDAPQTLDGHKILVDAGTYNESLLLHKAVSLFGENRTNAIINGYGAQWAVQIVACNVTVSGFTIKNGGKGLSSRIIPNGGIRLISNGSMISDNIIIENDYSGIWSGYYAILNWNIIENNFVSNNFYGIALSSGSSFNNLTKNIVTDNTHMGIFVSGRGNFLRKNLMSNNTYNFGVWGYSVSDFGQDIDTSNKVNGKPIYYLVDKSDVHIPSDMGYVAAISCKNVTVNYGSIRNVGAVFFVNVTDSVIKNAEVSHNYYFGIYLLSSHNNIIQNVTLARSSLHNLGLRDSNANIIKDSFIANSGTGIDLYNSSGNVIIRNTIIKNYHAIFLTYSNSNRICNNNFINNTDQIPIGAIKEENKWDYGYPFGGNYWSDYEGVDEKSGPNQDQLGSDGIGDEAYIIDVENQQMDKYPLMGMFSDFNATSEHHIQTVCNSTISDFQFNGTAIFFNVTGEDGTTGFCRICIPKALTNNTYKIFVNGTEVTHIPLPCSNRTHSYIYFTYNHSTQEVIIIPEFPPFLILPLFMIATLLAALMYRRKRTVKLHSFSNSRR